MVRSLRQLAHEYIFKLEEPEVSKVKSTVRNQYSSRQHNDIDDWPPTRLRRVALREPLVLKAIQKKNMDIVRNWFYLKPTDGKDNAPDRILKIIEDFDKRSSFRYKLYSAGVCSNIYGTGFLERTFVKDIKSGSNASNEINEKDEPLNLIVLNPEFITSREKLKDTNYWIYQEMTGGVEKKYINPDRLIVYTTDKLPFSDFGISKINILKNILQSKMNADVSAGEILSWFSHGIFDMKIEDMNEEQEKAMIKLFETHPNYYVHDEDYELKSLNPQSINPQPFYDYFYVNIASALIMPTHMLTGVQLGDVSGSEIGMGDYIHDVENIQNVVLTPLIEKIYKQLLESKGFKWKYDIVWNPIFVDELSEAKILQTRSYSAVNSKNAGIIDIVEARKILNDGIVDLDTQKVPKVEEKPVSKPNDQPNIEPQPVVKKTTVKNVITPLTDAQRDMIRMVAERERVLGEQILREQDAKKEANKE